jgi:hypothetical protein
VRLGAASFDRVELALVERQKKWRPTARRKRQRRIVATGPRAPVDEIAVFGDQPRGGAQTGPWRSLIRAQNVLS